MADSGSSPKAGPTTPGGAASRSSPASPSTPAPAHPGAGHLEVDPEWANNAGDDADSALSLHGVSDTTSVLSSIFKYREENGRTYHAYKASEAEYFMPNDERENERLDLQHHMCVRMQDDRLYVCPAGSEKPLKRVLDLGTGTGIWAIDFADEHPETSVVGVDLSPIQPDCVPPNVEFFVDDLEADWNYVTKFDLIYGRGLTGSIRDWPSLMARAFENLNPGGYFELCDPVNPITSDDGTVKEDSSLYKWNVLLLEASEKLGASLNSGRQYKQQMIDAGFEDVVQVEFKWPISSWPRDAKYKEVGAWNHVNTLAALQALSLMLFTKVLNWSVVEVEALLAGVRKDLKDKGIHGYWPVYVVYGKKPE